jgi:hypothetical protein
MGFINIPKNSIGAKNSFIGKEVLASKRCASNNL